MCHCLWQQDEKERNSCLAEQTCLQSSITFETCQSPGGIRAWLESLWKCTHFADVHKESTLPVQNRESGGAFN